MDIRKFLGRKISPGPAPGIDGQAGPGPSSATVAENAQESAPAARVVQFSRKRSRSGEAAPPAPRAAGHARAYAPAGITEQPAAPAQPSAPAADLPAQQAQQARRPRQLTQMFLDVGQRDFHASRCPQCGLLYSKGEETDERLHAAYHGNATKGLRHSSLPQEQTVLVDGTKGRVVLLSGSEAARCKKVQELGAFLEDQMGLIKGWLLQTGGSVFLYISAAKRIQGCVVAEHIKEAYAALPSAPPHSSSGPEQQPGSCGSAVQPASSSAGGAQQEGAAVGAAAAAEEAQPVLSVTRSSMGAAAEQQQVEPAQTIGLQPVPEQQAATAEAATAEAAGAAAASAPLHQMQQQQQPGQRRQLLLDRRQRLRAVCGVRLMWVSLEARRRGLASKLLDCLRSQFMQGYVIPRQELAFSQPTEAGAAFAQAYSGRRFLVYE